MSQAKPFLRTKIVATLGPASDAPDTIRAMVCAGMRVARLNFSHGSPAEHAARIARVRAAASAEGVAVAVLQDLQGPRLRVGAVVAGTVLTAGQDFVLDARRGPGDATGAGLAHARRISAAVRAGDRVLVDDGRLELVVRDVSPGVLRCVVRAGGPLGARKGVNLPDSAVELPALTDKDRADVRFGLAHGVDYIALSFVASAGHVRVLQDFIRRAGGDAPVVAKIERPEALAELAAIVGRADGVMVARGDLALEIGPERVPMAQKAIIRAANGAGIPVVTATQMLESMVYAPKPTRAETSDVANAIFDGTDAVMLSAETAVGAYPVASVAAMAAVAREAEAALPYGNLGAHDAVRAGAAVTQAISAAAVEIARRLGVAAILAGTTTGSTARAVARQRPEMPLVGVTPSAETYRRLALVWGVQPVVVALAGTTDDHVRGVMEAGAGLGAGGPGDRVVVISGQPLGRPGSTNMVQVRHIGDWLGD